MQLLSTIVILLTHYMVLLLMGRYSRLHFGPYHLCTTVHLGADGCAHFTECWSHVAYGIISMTTYTCYSSIGNPALASPSDFACKVSRELCNLTFCSVISFFRMSRLVAFLGQEVGLVQAEFRFKG